MSIRQDPDRWQRFCAPSSNSAAESLIHHQCMAVPSKLIGQLLTQLGLRDSVFLATKVWTHGKQAGIESMERSFARLQTKTIDLMQVHNLVDVATQLATMREWKAQGRFRYLGITHYNAGAFAEVANILAREQTGFPPDQLFDHGT